MIKKYNNIILSFKTLIGTAKNSQTRIMVKVEIFVAIVVRADRFKQKVFITTDHT
jgi:hypothetical protein